MGRLSKNTSAELGKGIFRMNTDFSIIIHAIILVPLIIAFAIGCDAYSQYNSVVKGFAWFFIALCMPLVGVILYIVFRPMEKVNKAK